jgi:hypothetical protein
MGMPGHEIVQKSHKAINRRARTLEEGSSRNHKRGKQILSNGKPYYWDRTENGGLPVGIGHRNLRAVSEGQEAAIPEEDRPEEDRPELPCLAGGGGGIFFFWQLGSLPPHFLHMKLNCRVHWNTVSSPPTVFLMFLLESSS